MKHGAVPRDLWLDPRFKSLRPLTKLVVLYVQTCPFGNSAHLFRVGPAKIALGCGISQKAARDILVDINSTGLLTYDFDHELIWLEPQMVTELGASLQPGDNRVRYLRKLAADLPECQIKRDFLDRYGIAYHVKTKGPCKGPLKPLSRALPPPLEAKAKDNIGSTDRKDLNTEVGSSTLHARGERLTPGLAGAA